MNWFFIITFTNFSITLFGFGFFVHPMLPQLWKSTESNKKNIKWDYFFQIFLRFFFFSDERDSIALVICFINLSLIWIVLFYIHQLVTKKLESLHPNESSIEPRSILTPAARENDYDESMNRRAMNHSEQRTLRSQKLKRNDRLSGKRKCTFEWSLFEFYFLFVCAQF